jgi:LacI family transcriptional regulator
MLGYNVVGLCRPGHHQEVAALGVTIVDIAKKLNISHVTVSRVLNGLGKSPVAEETRKRVLEAAREMGYYPNRMARALATGRSNVIAVSLPGLSLPMYGQVIRSLQSCLRKDGFNLIPFANGGGISLRGWPIDGALAFCAELSVGRFLQDSMDMKIPLVAMMTPEMNDYADYVDVDLYEASRDAVRHLVESGRKRVAFVVAEMSNRAGFSRLDAYLDVMRESDLPTEIITLNDVSRTCARDGICDYVKQNGCPDGFFCSNDDFALGTYRALRDLDLRIPEDTGIIGCDGIEDTEYIDPPISTIIQPVEAMCEKAWQFLKQRLDSPDLPQQRMMLKAHLEIRESTALRNRE